MSNYDFIQTGDDSTDNEEQFNEVGSMWTLGDHTTADESDRSALSQAIDDTLEGLDSEVDDDMAEVLQDASAMVENTRVSRFECPVEACGLGHSHSDHKHDIRTSFGVTDSFAEQMEGCPYCHCGVNELSMLMQFYPFINEQVFSGRDFSGVTAVEPSALEDMYRRYTQEGESVDMAASSVAKQRGLSPSHVAPLGHRDVVESFFKLRARIDDAADSAPIGSEMRGLISERREELLEATA